MTTQSSINRKRSAEQAALTTREETVSPKIIEEDETRLIRNSKEREKKLAIRKQILILQNLLPYTHRMTTLQTLCDAIRYIGELEQKVAVLEQTNASLTSDLNACNQAITANVQYQICDQMPIFTPDNDYSIFDNM